MMEGEGKAHTSSQRPALQLGSRRAFNPSKPYLANLSDLQVAWGWPQLFVSSFSCTRRLECAQRPPANGYETTFFTLRPFQYFLTRSCPLLVPI